MKCSKCSSNIAEEDAFCPECGIKVEHAEVDKTGKPSKKDDASSGGLHIHITKKTVIIGSVVLAVLVIAAAFVLYQWILPGTSKNQAMGLPDSGRATTTPTPIITVSPAQEVVDFKKAAGFATFQLKDWKLSPSGALTLVFVNKYGAPIGVTGISAKRSFGTTNYECSFTNGNVAFDLAENQEITLTTYAGDCSGGLILGDSYNLDVQIPFTANGVTHIDSGTITDVVKTMGTPVMTTSQTTRAQGTRFCIESVWNSTTQIVFTMRNCGSYDVTQADFSQTGYYIDSVKTACIPDVSTSFNVYDIRTVTCPAASYGSCTTAGGCPTRTVKITTVFGKADTVTYQYRQ